MPGKILPARGSRPNKNKKIVYVFPKKVIQKSVRLIWSIEKVKCETNRCNNQAKLTRYASCNSSWEDFFKPPEILPAGGTRQ